MNHLNTDGHETEIPSHEQIETIGRQLPSLHELADTLSTKPDIRVYTEATHILKGSARKDISEAEMVADLLVFCDRVKQLPVDRMEDAERALVGDVDKFVDSLYLLTHEAYEEAVEGLARRQMEWLAENNTRRIRFLVHRNKTESSQGKVAHDIAKAIAVHDEMLSDRIDVRLTEELADGLTSDTKLVLADDWAVSGNLISNDIANVYKTFDAKGVGAPLEVNFLLAREDQVTDGLRAVQRLEDSFPNHTVPPILAYYTTPSIEGIYKHDKATPTGSHSSVDYGFSQTLERMYVLLDRYEQGGEEPHMPYMAEIIPTYNYNY